MLPEHCRQSPRAVDLKVPFLAAFLALANGCGTTPPEHQNQKAFASPESAVEALAAATRKGDTAEMSAIFGPEGQEILSSGDPVADRMNREVFVVALGEGWKLEDAGKDSGGKDSRELIAGDEQWPFPIPLVKEREGWRFDTAAGKQEVLARRIGRNELAAIGVCRTYVLAQKQYASQGHDGKPAGSYAQKVKSEPGRHDGLYWATTRPGDKASPLGEFAATATSEGYSTSSTERVRPFHGYFFRILTQQGKDAPGGARSYVVNGEMKDGFALIAYPAEYGNSGIMTFIVNQDGVVYETDLGKETSKLAGAVTAYNPDETFRRVE
jgi:hypothetical protein